MSLVDQFEERRISVIVGITELLLEAGYLADERDCYLQTRRNS